jgi:hypothetical protein
MKSSALDSLIGVVALVGIVVAAILVGDAFRAHFHAFMGCALNLWIDAVLISMTA